MRGLGLFIAMCYGHKHPTCFPGGLRGPDGVHQSDALVPALVCKPLRTRLGRLRAHLEQEEVQVVADMDDASLARPEIDEEGVQAVTFLKDGCRERRPKSVDQQSAAAYCSDDLGCISLQKLVVGSRLPPCELASVGKAKSGSRTYDSRGLPARTGWGWGRDGEPGLDPMGTDAFLWRSTPPCSSKRRRKVWHALNR